jgi:hypothetical protein
MAHRRLALGIIASLLSACSGSHTAFDRTSSQATVGVVHPGLWTTSRPPKGVAARPGAAFGLAGVLTPILAVADNRPGRVLLRMRAGDDSSDNIYWLLLAGSVPVLEKASEDEWRSGRLLHLMTAENHESTRGPVTVRSHSALLNGVSLPFPGEILHMVLPSETGRFVALISTTPSDGPGTFRSWWLQHTALFTDLRLSYYGTLYIDVLDARTGTPLSQTHFSYTDTPDILYSSAAWAGDVVFLHPRNFIFGEIIVVAPRGP